MSQALPIDEGLPEKRRQRLEWVRSRMVMPDGRMLTLLSGGRMANLAGAEPKGDAIESRDPGFILQALSLQRIATPAESLERGPQPVPADINDALARRMLLAMGARY